MPKPNLLLLQTSWIASAEADSSAFDTASTAGTG
jgi:hypothetical protein